VGPEWLHLVWTQLFSMVVAAGFTILGFAAYANGEGAWRNWAGWLQWYGMNLVVSMSIGFSIHALMRLAFAIVGPERVRQLRGAKRGFFFATIPLVGLAVGWPLGSWLVGSAGPGWFRADNANNVAAGVLISIVISLVFYQFFAAKSRQIEAERRAAEAQLRLLQGQIEPHFLFNTLANVISLIDHDAPKARQMLESFTDYLRSSLTSLRHEQATLGGELDLVHNYLVLLKTRMEDRLQFSITSDPGLNDQRLPPLLLQPLVENAIHHGLEPKVEGGHVAVSARREGGQLWVTITDNGLGLGAPSRRKTGTGMALGNLRERLQAQYGDEASLTLTGAHPGTVATLRLPIQAAAQKAAA
jgi:two-component sensor histidine kinase